MNKIKKLMLIEDNKSDRFFFRTVLHDMNEAIELVEVNNCNEALEQLYQMTSFPDFIFMDSHMPVMSGLECLVILKKDERLKNIPVIIYSGSENPADERSFIAKGAAYFLTKKNNYEELPEAIRESIRSAREDKPRE